MGLFCVLFGLHNLFHLNIVPNSNISLMCSWDFTMVQTLELWQLRTNLVPCRPLCQSWRNSEGVLTNYFVQKNAKQVLVFPKITKNNFPLRAFQSEQIQGGRDPDSIHGCYRGMLLPWGSLLQHDHMPPATDISGHNEGMRPLYFHHIDLQSLFSYPLQQRDLMTSHLADFPNSALM